MAEGEKRILCVGLVCVDIVFYAPKYPEEDTDMRVSDHRWHRGGNASNTCSVLGQLGHRPEFLGTLGGGIEGRFIRDDFERDGISVSHCPSYTDLATPTSVVIANEASGSRTILHSNKSFPEVTFEQFCQLDLDAYSWVHFEGRVHNVPEVCRMLRHVTSYNEEQGRHVTTSVELEKPSEEVKELSGLADVVFLSKDFAVFNGYDDMRSAVEEFAPKCRPGARIICAWGDKGAAARDVTGHVVSSTAFSPAKVVDTLGAGDTFIGAILFELNGGSDLQTAVTRACRVAGQKCGMRGIRGLGEALMVEAGSADL